MNKARVTKAFDDLTKALNNLRDAFLPTYVGMNMAAPVDYCSEIVFNDLMKQSRRWTSQQQGKDYGQGPPLKLDGMDYPVALQDNSCFAETLMLVDIGPYGPQGPYTLYFDGEGTIRFNGKAMGTYSNNNSIVPINHGAANFLALQIVRTNPDNPVRNIKLVTTSKNVGAVFDESFINRYKNKYDVVRLMDWLNINNNDGYDWKDRPKLIDRSYASGKGVPLEIACSFSNAIESDIWINIPHLASNTWITNFFTTLKDQLNSSRKIYLEYSNECWNSIMTQATWCQEQGVALKLATDPYEAQIRFYSQRAQEIFNIAKDFFGSRIVRVLSAHHKDIRTGIWALEHTQAYLNCDAVAIAPYWGHADRLGDLDNSSVDNILDRCLALIDENKAYTANFASLAQKYNIDLFAYEGGQHMYKPDGTNVVVDKLCQVNRHPRMKDLYLKDLENWKQLGGDLFMIFSSMGVYGRAGSWGVLEYYNQTTSPKLEAINAYLG